jgi:hypothetical protein
MEKSGVMLSNQTARARRCGASLLILPPFPSPLCLSLSPFSLAATIGSAAALRQRRAPTWYARPFASLPAVRNRASQTLM